MLLHCECGGLALSVFLVIRNEFYFPYSDLTLKDCHTPALRQKLVASTASEARESHQVL